MDRHLPLRRELAIPITASRHQVNERFCISPDMSTGDTMFQMGRPKQPETHFVGLSFYDKFKLEVFRKGSPR